MPVNITNVSIKPDRTSNAGLNQNYNQQLAPNTLQYDRSFWVSGLSIDNAPSEMIFAAEEAIKSIIPVGTPCAYNPSCLARGYKAMPETSSTDGVMFVVSYIYSNSGGNTTTWDIAIDNYLEYVETDTEFTDDTGANSQSIVIGPSGSVQYYPSWMVKGTSKPSGGAGTPTGPAADIHPTTQFLCPRNRWIYTRTITNQDKAKSWVQDSVNYIGCTNSDALFGSSPGTILIMDCGMEIATYQGVRTARLELCRKPEGWNPWVRYANVKVPTPQNIWRNNDGYGANGIYQSKQYAQVNIGGTVLTYFD